MSTSNDWLAEEFTRARAELNDLPRWAQPVRTALAPPVIAGKIKWPQSRPRSAEYAPRHAAWASDPARITSPEELEALPTGSIVSCGSYHAAVRRSNGNWIITTWRSEALSGQLWLYYADNIDGIVRLR